MFEQKPEQKIITTSIVLFAFAALIGLQMFDTLIEPEPLTQAEIDKEVIEMLEREVEGFDGNLPVMFNDKTRLDKAKVEGDRLVVYYYTMVTYKSTDPDQDAEAMKNKYFPIIKEDICSSIDMRKSLKKGRDYRFTYNDMDGVKIVSVDLSRNDCGGFSLVDYLIFKSRR